MRILRETKRAHPVVKPTHFVVKPTHSYAWALLTECVGFV